MASLLAVQGGLVIVCCINLHDFCRCSIKKPSHDFRSQFIQHPYLKIGLIIHTIKDVRIIFSSDSESPRGSRCRYCTRFHITLCSGMPEMESAEMGMNWTAHICFSRLLYVVEKSSKIFIASLF